MGLFRLDAAILAKLQADAQLAAFATDGIFYGDGKPHATKYVTVTRMESLPEVEFADYAWKTVHYQVKAVQQSKSSSDVETAADRIDAVMHDWTLTATGFQVMDLVVMTEIRYSEFDQTNVDLTWQHGGGQYEVTVIPT